METIDRSNMMIVPLPVSGEQVWVVRPKDYVDPSSIPPVQQQGAIAGQNQCMHCGQYFNSPNVLAEHARIRHPIASGQGDATLIPMPDGSLVPADAVPELIREKQEAIISAGKAREAMLEARTAELEAKLEELAEKFTARTVKPAKDK